MESGRPNRRKAAPPASKSSKGKQANQSANDLKAASKDQTNDQDLIESQQEAKSDKSKEPDQQNDGISENASDQPKPSENSESMVIEEPQKLTSVKSSREILYGDDASEETKKQIEDLFETAQAFASKEDYTQAINIYNKIVKLNEKSTAAWIAMGHCFAMQDEDYRALQSYQQALSITPESQKDDQLWYGIGLLYQKTEDWKNAETSFRNALKLNPSPTLKGEILYHLGVIMKVRGEHQEGIKMLTNSILLGSFSVERMVDILCNIGTSLEELNEMNEATQTYKYALILDENNYRALQCFGWLYFQLDKVTEALEYLNKVSAINEEDPNTQYMKGRCNLKLGQHYKAYEAFHKAISKDQSNSTFWSSLGILFSELNQLKSAHECFSNALKLNPKSPENYFNMGCVFELCSQWNDALTMYDKSIELQPNFQLALNRKQGIATQTESKNATIEVQFKHHKFALSFMKDIDKEKPLFFFPQATQNTSAYSSERFGLGDTKETERSSIGDSALQNLLNQAGANTTPIPSFQTGGSQASGNILNGLSGVPSLSSKGLNPPSGASKILQSEPSNTFLSKQLASPSNVLKPSSLPQQSNSFLPNWNPLQSIKQNINPPNAFVLTPPSRTFPGLPADQSKGEEVQSGASDKASEKGSKNVASEGSSEQSGFKANRSIASPIVLRHDPQVLTDKKDEISTTKGAEETKTQNAGFKFTQKGGRGEEGIIPQKKVKLDKGGEAIVESTSPQTEKNASSKKNQSVVLRPSPLNK